MIWSEGLQGAQAIGKMNTSIFFNYPEGKAADTEESLVFLAQLSSEEWSRLLAVAHPRAFRKGDIVIPQGDLAREFYIVAEGCLEISYTTPKGRKVLVAAIEPQSVFGEQAFFDGQPRSAGVEATSDGQLFVFSPTAFEQLAVREPSLARTVLFELGRVLSMRLRKMTSLVSRQRP